MAALDPVEFAQKGYACPVTLLAPEEMAELRPKIEEVVSAPSPLFDSADRDLQRNFRNRHLDSMTVLDLACNANLLAAISSVLGENLVLWRSDFFIQADTDPHTEWHQDRQFSGRRRLPSLQLAGPDGKLASSKYDEDSMRGDVPLPPSISAWIAIADTDRHTGCVKVVESSNIGGIIPVRPIRPGETGIFGKGTVLDYTIPDEKVRHMELLAGQCFVFDRLTLHGSEPTPPGHRRIGIAMRFTTPETLIYHGYSIDSQGFSTENYRALLVAGHDHHGYNGQIVEPVAQRRETISAQASS